MIGVGDTSLIETARWPAVVVIQGNDAESPSNQRVAEAPHAVQGTCTVSGAGSRVEQKGAQEWCAPGMWSRSARRCTMNVNGLVLRGRDCPGCICNSSIHTWNRVIASSALSRNGRLYRAGMAWGPGPVGFGSARQVRPTIEARRVSGGRLSAHRRTRYGTSSLLITILNTSNVFWIRFGMTRVSWERKLKLVYPD